MFCCLFPSVLIPLFSWLSLVWPCITETFSLTVHERLHLGDWHGGAGCRFGRIGLWVRVSGEAAQGADVQRVGGLDHGEVLLRHRHHLDLRGVRFLWSFCLKFLERTTERRSISSCSRTDVWTESDQKSSELTESRGPLTLPGSWFCWTKLNICFL